MKEPQAGDTGCTSMWVRGRGTDASVAEAGGFLSRRESTESKPEYTRVKKADMVPFEDRRGDAGKKGGIASSHL